MEGSASVILSARSRLEVWNSPARVVSVAGGVVRRIGRGGASRADGIFLAKVGYASLAGRSRSQVQARSRSRSTISARVGVLCLLRTARLR